MLRNIANLSITETLTFLDVEKLDIFNGVVIDNFDFHLFINHLMNICHSFINDLINSLFTKNGSIYGTLKHSLKKMNLHMKMNYRRQ